MEKKILIGALLTLIILFGVYIYRSPSSPQCEELDKNMRKLVEDANYCSVDSDCMIKLAGFECPFGCYDLFNKNVDLKTLETQVNAYVNKCYEGDNVCEACLRSPNQEEVICKNNKCVDTRFE